MDGWVNRWMDGWMDGWMDDGWMMDGWIDGSTIDGLKRVNCLTFCINPNASLSAIKSGFSCINTCINK